ncbi:MAG: Uma2 family endonuclease [Trueperaceae bacterium]
MKPATLTSVAREPKLLNLENGDRLTRAEFERRYKHRSEVKKAELVEGIVYMSSPVRAKQHGHPHTRLVTWLTLYENATPFTFTADNATVRLDLDNEPQPDILLLIEHEAGGQAIFDEDGYITGAPELVVEIAASSASYDLHDKLKAYRRNGVKEYIIWRTEDQQLDWLVLNEGQYYPLRAEESMYKSPNFPGLWLDSDALLQNDLSKVLEALQQGLASKDHQQFTETLLRKAEAHHG